MKKITSTLSSALLIFAASLSLTSAAKSAEFYVVQADLLEYISKQVTQFVKCCTNMRLVQTWKKKKKQIKLTDVQLHQLVDQTIILAR